MLRKWQNELTFVEHDRVSNVAATMCPRFVVPWETPDCNGIAKEKKEVTPASITHRLLLGVQEHHHLLASQQLPSLQEGHLFLPGLGHRWRPWGLPPELPGQVRPCLPSGQQSLRKSTGWLERGGRLQPIASIARYRSTPPLDLILIPNTQPNPRDRVGGGAGRL